MAAGEETAETVEAGVEDPEEVVDRAEEVTKQAGQGGQMHDEEESTQEFCRLNISLQSPCKVVFSLCVWYHALVRHPVDITVKERSEETNDVVVGDKEDNEETADQNLRSTPVQCSALNYAVHY